jgi:hypothetical protein
VADHEAPRRLALPEIPLKARQYAYGVLLAAQPLVVAYGLTTDGKAALWLGFGSAVLGLSLARANAKEPPA